MDRQRFKLAAVAVGGIGVIGLLARVIAGRSGEGGRLDDFTFDASSARSASLDQGWALLRDPASPLRRFTDSAKLPCSNFTAAFLLSLAGLSPSSPTIVSAWRDLDLDLWRAVNLWDATQPWSAGPAVYRFLRSRVGSGVLSSIHRAVTGETAPQLTPGRWHQVQRWTRAGERVIPKPEGPDSGHSFLVWVEPDGSSVVVDSDTGRGLTVERRRWYTPGRDYQIVTLPSLAARTMV